MASLRMLPLGMRRTALARLSTAARRHRPLNLTPFASPLLLVLHPDTLVRRAPHLARDNVQALKQLNVFLELAARGCNNDAHRARAQVLELASASHDDPSSPLRFPLAFHVADEQQADGFRKCEYIVQVPGQLVRRTLANTTASAARDAYADPTHAPFARAWQRLTKRALKDLFHVSGVQLPAAGSAASESSPALVSLADWLAEAAEEDLAEANRVQAAAHNRQQQREHEQFDAQFHRMLTREKNVVHTATTGLEDGPTEQHAVLTALLSKRLVLPKLRDAEERAAVFRWIAGFLLAYFMELRMHALVWNKIALLVTVDVEKKDEQGDGQEEATASGLETHWDRARPDLGMGVLIPLGVDSMELLDYLYERVDELERALDAFDAKNSKGKRRERKHTSPDDSGRDFRGADNSKRRPRPRRAHFYEQELASLYQRK